MSFLAELVNRKNELTHTRTKVTTPGGEVLSEEMGVNGYVVEAQSERRPGFVVDTKPDLQVAKILPGLSMGSQDVAADQELLLSHSVTHILNVGHDSTPTHEGISYSHVPLLDLPESDLIRSLPQCIDLIDGTRETGGHVFVHCNAGVSRSASIVIAYLMQDQQIGYNEAFNRLKQIRPTIRPNEGFVNQLKQYEMEIAQ